MDWGEIGGPGTGLLTKVKILVGGGMGASKGLLEVAGDSFERLTDSPDMTAGAKYEASICAGDGGGEYGARLKTLISQLILRMGCVGEKGILPLDQH